MFSRALKRIFITAFFIVAKNNNDKNLKIVPIFINRRMDTLCFITNK